MTTNNSPCATRRQRPFTRVNALSPLDRPMRTLRLPLRTWMTLRRLGNSSRVSAYSANKYYKHWRSRLPLVSQKPNFTADPATRCPNDRVSRGYRRCYGRPSVLPARTVYGGCVCRIYPSLQAGLLARYVHSACEGVPVKASITFEQPYWLIS